MQDWRDYGIDLDNIDMTARTVTVDHEILYRKRDGKTQFYAKETKTKTGIRIIPMTEDVCVNVSGSKGERWDGPYRENFTEETWRDMVKSIQEIIDDVKPQNTFYTIEPMPWMYPMGPEGTEDFWKMWTENNLPFIWIYLTDTSPQRYFRHAEFMEKCFEMLGAHIKSCHLKDVLLKQEFTLQLEETACGQGGLNLKKYRELIDRTDPDIPVIIEHLDSDREYLESLGYIRNIFKI